MKAGSRREFIRQAGVLVPGMALGTTGVQRAITALRSAPNLAEGSAKVKLSLNAWSYNVQLFRHIEGKAGGMSLFDMLDECARLELDAVDPTGYFFPGYPDRPDRAFINKFKRHAFRLGLAISGTGIRNDFATTDTTKRQEGITLTKRWIEVAAELGAPVIRVFAGKKPEGHSWDEAAVWLAECLQECAEYGQEHGVIVGVQNHGGMLKSSAEVLKILEMASSDWLGAIVDTGYFLTDDPYKDIEAVIPHAVNWQVKSLLSDRRGGPIDLHRLVRIIRASNYRGYVPIETLPVRGREADYDALKEVPKLLAALREALDQNPGR